jgi:RNA polymerase sigma factor (sigma-70 family)
MTTPTLGSKVVSLNRTSEKSVDNNKAAIARLVEKHECELRRFLRSSIRNPADVDDIVQDVFCRVLRDNRVLKSTAPRAYLYKVARNLLIDRYRQNKIRSNVDKSRAQDIVALSDTRSSLNYNEMTVAYQDALSELPDQCRKVFLMRSYDGLTNSEIAELLGLSMRMVQKHLVKAMAHFLDKLCKCD